MKFLSAFLAVLLATRSGIAQRPTFSMTTSTVIVNVTVLDGKGQPVENLRASDFSLTEDGKPQRLRSVDLQRLQTKVLGPLPVTPPPPVETHGYNPDADKPKAATGLESAFQDRRLIVMLFDLSSMQPAEQIRARTAAQKFVNTQLTASDTVSVLSFGSQLNTLQDFTADREQLLTAINRLRPGDSSENALTADAGADAQDQSGQFVADETEFNIFNSDIKLAALQDAARRLAQYPEKKALIYFSSGIQRNGVDNQSQLRATVNTAIRANVAFYPIDARGLSAQVPGGDASQAGAVGTNLFSGSAQRSNRENFNNQQETLVSLAADTGGKALLDSNDLTAGMRQVQSDFNSYYVLTYVSTNTKEDGRYRRIQVKLAPSVSEAHVKLNYRPGYYAPTTFNRMQEGDKEAQLQQALQAENPVTDLPIAVEVDYFRLEKAKYFVPIAVKIPGSALSFEQKGKKETTELDFVAAVTDSRGHAAASVRDTIPVKVDTQTASAVSKRNIQYDTGVTLTPGKYKLRFVARENGEGKAGTFESTFVIPDLSAATNLRVSSVILSNQRQAVQEQIAGAKNTKKVLSANPLIDTNGTKLVPNVTHVFTPGQKLLVYAEVYDPATPASLPSSFRVADVQASLALYRNNKQVFLGPPVQAHRFPSDRPGVLPLNLQLPLPALASGEYICQLNIIDGIGHKFAFPRRPVAILVR